MVRDTHSASDTEQVHRGPTEICQGNRLWERSGETASGQDAEAHALESDRDSDWQRHINERASERDGRRDRDKTQRKTARRRRVSARRGAHTATEKVRWRKQTQKLRRRS